MGKENDIQWHLGFCAAMELELREYADRLEFHREYPLSRKPLLIDLLVVEKTGDFEIANDIGQIFQKHNIMEYKSENVQSVRLQDHLLPHSIRPFSATGRSLIHNT